MKQYGNLLKNIMFTAMLVVTGLLQAAGNTATAASPWTSPKMPSTFGISLPANPTTALYYSHTNTNVNGNAELAWYNAWQSPTPGVFVIEWHTNSIRDISPAFSAFMPVLPANLTPATLTLQNLRDLYPAKGATDSVFTVANATIRFVLGGWGYTDNRVDIGLKNATSYADGSNFRRAGYGSSRNTWVSGRNLAEAISCRESGSGLIGFGPTDAVTAYRMTLDVSNKAAPKFEVAVKKPSEPHSAYRVILNESDYPGLTAPTSPFSTLAATPLPRYFSLTCFADAIVRNVKILNPRFAEPTTAMPTSFTNDSNPAFFVGNELGAPGVGAFEFTINPGQDSQGMYNAMVTLVPSLDDASIEADSACPTNTPNGPFRNSFTISLGDPSKGTFYTMNGWTGAKVPCSTTAGNCFATTGAASVPLRIRIEMNQLTKSLVIKTKAVAATDSTAISDGSGFTTTIFDSATLPAGSNTLFDGLKGKLYHFALYSAYGPNTYTNVCSGTLGGTTAPTGYAEVLNLAFHIDGGVGMGATDAYVISQNQDLVMNLNAGNLRPFGTLPADAGNLTSITANGTEVYVCAESGKVYRAAMSDGAFTLVSTLNGKNIRQFCSGAAGHFLALDSAGMLWHQPGVGLDLKVVPVSGRAASIAVSRGASPTMFVLLADGSLLKGTTSLAPMPAMVGTTPLVFRSLAASSDTNIMGVTTDGKLALFSAPATPAGAAAAWALLNTAGTAPAPASGFMAAYMAAADKAALISFDGDLYMPANTSTRSGGTGTGSGTGSGTGTGTGSGTGSGTGTTPKKSAPKKTAPKRGKTVTKTTTTTRTTKTAPKTTATTKATVTPKPKATA